MPIELAGYSFAVVAGVAAILLFLEIIHRNFKGCRALYVFALALTTASWAGLEWGLWLEGKNMFRLILYPAVPLDFFFAVWIAFAVWAGEKTRERKIAIAWLCALAAIFVIASYCMDCFRF